MNCFLYLVGCWTSLLSLDCDFKETSASPIYFYWTPFLTETWNSCYKVIRNNFWQRISWLSQRWRTQWNAIRNVNCRIQWIIESLNAYCALWYSGEHACLSTFSFSRPPLRRVPWWLSLCLLLTTYWGFRLTWNGTPKVDSCLSLRNSNWMRFLSLFLVLGEKWLAGQCLWQKEPNESCLSEPWSQIR